MTVSKMRLVQVGSQSFEIPEAFAEAVSSRMRKYQQEVADLKRLLKECNGDTRKLITMSRLLKVYLETDIGTGE